MDDTKKARKGNPGGRPRLPRVVRLVLVTEAVAARLDADGVVERANIERLGVKP